ncbi:hypothetical protein CDAR_487691 [Caerostris darwini]|uniref:Uncharacterized protein n=1 Tax=Caerostris darwini TaxID=1538125 RepID=A0AAV4PRT9_9ARAC|nr:hypothetical protein CDAR_487691 [Caerostris darwini]
MRNLISKHFLFLAPYPTIVFRAISNDFQPDTHEAVQMCPKFPKPEAHNEKDLSPINAIWVSGCRDNQGLTVFNQPHDNTQIFSSQYGLTPDKTESGLMESVPLLSNMQGILCRISANSTRTAFTLATV